MTMILNQGSMPPGIRVKTQELGFIRLWVPDGRYAHLSLDDFLAIFIYVFENTDLEEKDQRLAFLERLKNAQQVDGFNKGAKRLEFPLGKP